MTKKLKRRIFNGVAGIFLVIGGSLLSPQFDLRVIAGILCFIMFVLIYIEFGTFQNTIDKSIEKKIREADKE